MVAACPGCGAPVSSTGEWCSSCAPPASRAVPAGRPAPAGIFVGRHRELSLLQARVARAIEGSGGTVMLLGEAGIGKTRIAQELDLLARRAGAVVLWGECYEGDGS